ncbi:MAG: NTP transferase domain-containing protein [Erysipelotrichaceae bacterium]|nr:NTP transferase domain-containing protein [Erysipelotrichaceae bacterium]
MTSAIVLAAGKGTRMRSQKAKTMHKVMDKPMLSHILTTLEKLHIDDVIFVVGHGADSIEEYYGNKVGYALQQPQLGSGHAVMMASQLKYKSGKTLIISGDCPLIQPETYQKLLDANDEYPLVVLTTKLDNPASYGRIIRNRFGDLEKIVEKKDCNESELLVKEVNAGIYCVDNQLLWKYLPEIDNNNAQHEYYVTDLVAIFKRHGHRVGAVVHDDPQELSGINTRRELAAATEWLRDRINNYWMDNGVTLTSPKETYISTETVIGEDTVIHGNVRIEGKTVIGSANEITEGSRICNSQIGSDNFLDKVVITDSRLGNRINAGPWVRMDGCRIEDGSVIPSFTDCSAEKKPAETARTDFRSRLFADRTEETEEERPFGRRFINRK